MTENIFDVLTKKYTQLTKTERKVADFVFANKAAVQYYSIASFAENCGVGEASVFRFCKSLSLGGYNEFKLAVARSLMQNEVYNEKTEKAPSMFGKVVATDSFSDLCQKLYNSQVSALSQTIDLAKASDFERASTLLTAAKRVFCFGQGNSLILAMIAWSRFISVSKKFYCVEDSHLQATNAALCDEEDVILFFSYSGSTRDMMDILPAAKKNGARIILVTRFENSPAAKLADVVLMCGSNEGPLQVGSMAAKVAQLMVIDILFNEYWIKNERECEQNTEATAQIISKKLI